MSENGGLAVFQDWTPISADFDSRAELLPDQYVVLFARQSGDGWEFARDTINLSQLEDVEVLDS